MVAAASSRELKITMSIRADAYRHVRILEQRELGVSRRVVIPKTY